MFMSSWLQLCIHRGTDILKTSITVWRGIFSPEVTKQNICPAGALCFILKVLHFSVQDLQDSLLREMKLLVHVGCWIRECCRNYSGPVNVWWENRETSMECLLFVFQNKLPHYCSTNAPCNAASTGRTVCMISPSCISETTLILNFYRHCYGNHKYVKMHLINVLYWY